MNKKLSLAQILNQANTIKDKEERRAFLQANDSTVLRLLITMIYDENLRWDLPYGSPPYVKNADVDCYGNLFSQLKKLLMFHAGQRQDIPPFKKEMLYIQLLESIHPDDADLLIKIKDKSEKNNIDHSIYPNLRRQFIRATFPGIPVLPDSRTLEKNDE